MRLVIGLIAFVVLYFVGCVILGAVAGGIAGYHDPQNAAQAGEIAGAAAVLEYRLLIAATAALLAFFWLTLPILRAQSPSEA